MKRCGRDDIDRVVASIVKVIPALDRTRRNYAGANRQRRRAKEETHSRIGFLGDHVVCDGSCKHVIDIVEVQAYFCTKDVLKTMRELGRLK